MNTIFILSLKDFFSAKFLKFALLPFIFSALILAFLFYIGFGYLLDYLYYLSNDGIFTSLMGFKIISLSFGLLGILVGSVFSIYLSVFLALFILSFLTPFIVKTLKQKYNYPDSQGLSNFYVFKEGLWIFMKFCLLFCFATLILILPFVGFFVYYFVLYYLFHKILVLDVASCILNKEDFQDLKQKANLELILITFAFYFLACVPFLGLLLQVFFVIFLSHYLYQKYFKTIS